MTKTIHAVYENGAFYPTERVDLPDRCEVQFEVTVTSARLRRSWGEGIKRSAGVAADVPEFDEVFEQIARERNAATFRDERNRVVE